MDPIGEAARVDPQARPRQVADEEERDEPEGHPEADREEEHPRRADSDERVVEGGGGRPHAGDEVSHDPGNQTRKEQRVFEMSEVENLDAEEGARDRGAEDGLDPFAPGGRGDSAGGVD